MPYCPSPPQVLATALACQSDHIQPIFQHHISACPLQPGWLTSVTRS